MDQKAVITRFPPSPTGYLHIGGVRTALFNYLFAAHYGGRMYLRFEDTDRERSKQEYEDDIFAALRWTSIPYEMPAIARQSERLDVYKKHFMSLIERGLAYEAEEAENNPGKKVVRFRNPNKVISFFDLVRGEVTFDTTELEDFVIARSIDEPLYHLAVVIDDHEMGVTHVIRGEEHISNTPRQILILEALGFERPLYAHIPLILAPDKSKLSKRHGAVSANEYQAQGYVPEAMVNYLALLGWNPGGEQEIFSLDELVQQFTLEKVHKSGAVFDIEKLKWFNHEHIKRLTDNEFVERMEAFVSKSKTGAFTLPAYFPKVAPLLKERAETLLEAQNALQEGEFSFMEGEVAYPPDLLLKGAKAEAGVVKEHLAMVQNMFSNMGAKDFTAEAVKEAVFPYATEQGRASVLWPLRVALSGKEKSPDPFTLCSLLGKEMVGKRIEQALQLL